MSRILRRPMFRGGSVDSRGTGITSGLGYASGGQVTPKRGLVEEPGGYAGEKMEDILSRNFGRTEAGGKFKVFGQEIPGTDILLDDEGVPYDPEYIQEILKKNRADLNSALSLLPVGRTIRGANMLRSGLGTAKSVPSFSKVKDFFTKYPESSKKVIGPPKSPALFGTNRYFSEKLGPGLQNTKEYLKDSLGGVGKLKDYSGLIGVGGIGGTYALAKGYEAWKEKDSKKETETEKVKVKKNNQDIIKKIMSEEKSDTEVMQEYMDMFSEAYGTDKEALNRSRFLEIAKFGANILAQPGGDSLGEVLGKAGAPALEGMSKIEESENQGQRQLKGLAIQAAIQKMDNPLLDNAKTISRYTGVPVAKVLERELEKGTGQLETNKFRYRESLASAIETKLQGKNIDLDKYSISDIMIEKGLNTSNIEFHSNPYETSEDLVVDQIYVFTKPSKGNYVGKWNGKGFDIIK